MPFTRALLSIAILAVGILGVTVAPAAAQDKVITLSKSLPESVAAPLRDELRRRARRDGTIRLIIGLAVPMRDEDTLTRAQVIEQERNLSAQQDAFIKRVFANSLSADTYVDKFDIIPTVTLDATPDQPPFSGPTRMLV